MSKILDEVKKLFIHNEGVELVQIVDAVGSTPRAEGAYMIVDSVGNSYGTIGGGQVEFLATKKAKKFLDNKENGVCEYNLSQNASKNIAMVCGGDISLKFTYLEPGEKSLSIIKNIEDESSGGKVYIFGAGHVSVCTCSLLKNVGFSVTVWDDREEFANANRFPDASKIIVSNYNDILNNKDISITKDDYILIMTRGHVFDYEVEKQILKIMPHYIGVIGSHTKTKTLNDQLLKDGFSKADLEKVCAPVGLKIGAESPEEIAVSIVAEIILYRAKKENRRKIYSK